MPKVRWIKINSDGAVSKSGGYGGGGAVLRDHNAAFIAGSCYHFPHVTDPEATEILACRQALRMALEMNLDRVHIELDCLSAVQRIKREQQDLSVVGPWIREIKLMLASCVEFRVSWVCRNANAAAHKLARVGVGEGVCSNWFGTPLIVSWM